MNLLDEDGKFVDKKVTVRHKEDILVVPSNRS